MTTPGDSVASLRIMTSQVWWLTTLILALGRQTHANLCKFKTILVYISSSRTTRVYKEPLSQKERKEEEKRKRETETEKETAVNQACQAV